MLWSWWACTVVDDTDPVGDSDPIVDTDPIDDDVDTDGDGVPDAADCEKYDPTVYPGAAEVAWNGKDDDCDGRTDADGPYVGTTSVRANTIYDGKSYAWTLSCPTTLTRTAATISFDVACTTDPEVPIQRQALGEEVHVEELDNIAAEGRFSGDARVWSTDGWDSNGTAIATWSGDEVALTVGMDAVFLDLVGVGSVVFAP